MEGEKVDNKGAKDILSDMRDQHLYFLGDSEIKDEWQEKYLKEALACDSGAKALSGLITGIKIDKGIIADSIQHYGKKTIKARSAWKNAQNLSKQSARQSVEKSTVIT